MSLLDKSQYGAITRRAERMAGVEGCLSPDSTRKRDRRSVLARRVATWFIAKHHSIPETAAITGNSERTVRHRVGSMRLSAKVLAADDLEAMHRKISKIDILPPPK